MARLVLRKATLPGFGPALMPGDEAAYDDLARVPDKTWVRADVRQERSPQHHRYAQALFSKTYALLPESVAKFYPHRDNWIDTIKIEAGHREQIVRFDGTVEFKPKSIAFSEMDEMEFRDFMRRAKNLIAEYLMPLIATPENARSPEIRDLERLLFGRETDEAA